MKLALSFALCIGLLFNATISRQTNGTDATPEATETQLATEISTAPATEPATEAATAPAGPTLRDLATARGLAIGTAVNIVALRNVLLYRTTLAREFNLLVPEVDMKMGLLRPARDKFDFANADLIMDFAKEHDLKVRGHTLVWHNQLPGWVTVGTFTREQLLDVMHEHIQTVVSRYAGRITAWDVVNEAVDDDAQLRKSVWLNTIGPDYIDNAFRWAHEADPNAKLFYNDYGGEELNAKSDAIYALVKDMKARGVPIDGVGLQMHVSIGKPPDPASVAANIKRLNDLGLQVQITEMDVKLQDGTGTPDEQLAAQATIYRNMAEVCLTAQRCTAFVMWGFTDRFSWIPAYTHKPDSPLLFDKTYQPKPAFDALVRLLTTNE